MRPLICLCMIVKNESHGIRKTLESFHSWIDTWCILDTCSTDNTTEIIQEVMKDISGILHIEPFVPFEDTGIIDYSATRNRCLALAKERNPVFTLMIDSDETLENGEVLRSFCLEHKDDSTPAWMVERSENQLKYTSARLLRTDSDWEYVGPIHEVPSGEDCGSVSGIVINYDMLPQSREATTKRWERDKVVLEKLYSQNPKNARTLFYLAQTWECLGKDLLAINCYEECVLVSKWSEEIYECKYRMIKCHERYGDCKWPEIQEFYLRLYSEYPHRIESIYNIIDHWHKEDNHELVCFFAKEVFNKPIPTNDILFVEQDVYKWKLAYLLGIHGFYSKDNREIGRIAADKAATNFPGDKTHYKHNASYYAQKASDEFSGFTSKLIDIVPEPSHEKLLNPSIMISNGRKCGVVRQVNYHIVNGYYHWDDKSNCIQTKNWWVDFDSNWNVTSKREILDLTCTPRTDFPAHGFEDCRIFHKDGTDYLSCTVADFTKTSDGDGAREIVLLTLDNKHDAIKATPLRGDWSKYHQKNWMPFDSLEGFQWVYSTNPLCIINPFFKHSVVPEKSGELRGGSQAIWVRSGYLWLTHEVTFGGSSRHYLHRFVYMTPQNKISMTRPFYFEELGIEYAAGIALENNTIVVSYGVKDSSAWLGFLPLRSILDKLQ